MLHLADTIREDGDTTRPRYEALDAWAAKQKAGSKGTSDSDDDRRDAGDRFHAIDAGGRRRPDDEVPRAEHLSST